MYTNSDASSVVESMKLATAQLGEIEFFEDTLIYFASGIIGFENCRRFVVINSSEYEPFRWLFTIDGKDFGLPVLNPHEISSEFYNGLPRRLTKRLLASEDTLEALCIVNLNGNGGNATINLKSPIIIDKESKIGEQLILESDKLPLAHPIW